MMAQNHPFLAHYFAGVSILLLLVSISASGQGTAFTYQGKLTDSGSPANGTYDLQFKLFDTQTTGTGIQQGSTVSKAGVQVTAGIFTTTLDFSSNVFTGAARFLEIGVRPAGNPNPHTVLSPRQPINSSPYAIQTINSQQLGGLPSSRFVQSDASGNVGIGTASPTAKLTVRGAGAFNAPGAARFDLFNTTANTGFLEHVTDAGLLQFATTGGATRMVIDPFGNIGIGTAGPTAKLTVAGTGAFNSPGAARIDLFNTTANTGFLQHVTDAGLLQFATTSGVTRMVIATNGNIGVGTATPTAKLSVSGSGIFNAVGAARFDLFNTTANTGFLQHVTDSGLLQFTTTGGVTRMVIDPNGNVGVGTVTPSAKLQIAGSGTNGYTLGVEGNVTQNLSNYGFAKAMLHVTDSGTIDRCFNSTLAGVEMATPPCGFASSLLSTGIYPIDFRFPVNGRFVVVTVGARTMNTIVPNIDYGDGNGGSPNLITVKIHETSTGAFNFGSFTLIVY
jgi:hypothetical protein